MKTLKCLAVVLGFLAGAPAADAQEEALITFSVMKPELTVKLAQAVMEACRAEGDGEHDHRRGERQHRGRADALADGAAQGEDAAGAHQEGADDMAAQLARVVAGLPADIVLAPGHGCGAQRDADIANPASQ